MKPVQGAIFTFLGSNQGAAREKPGSQLHLTPCKSNLETTHLKIGVTAVAKYADLANQHKKTHRLYDSQPLATRCGVICWICCSGWAREWGLKSYNCKL